MWTNAPLKHMIATITQNAQTTMAHSLVPVKVDGLVMERHVLVVIITFSCIILSPLIDPVEEDVCNLAIYTSSCRDSYFAFVDAAFK